MWRTSRTQPRKSPGAADDVPWGGPIPTGPVAFDPELRTAAELAGGCPAAGPKHAA